LSTTAIELESLSFKIDTSDSKEQPNRQEDVAKGKKVRKEETGSGNSSTGSVKAGSGPAKFKYRLDGPLGEDNV
jgi:hypothetical protein